MADINTFVAQSSIILTGDISRRIKKYDTEEERQQAINLEYNTTFSGYK